VIRDTESLAGATAEKYQYIRDQQLKQQDRGFLRFKDKNVPVMPEMTYYNLELPKVKVTKEVMITPAAAEVIDGDEEAAPAEQEAPVSEE
jgi:general secretion pathway protein D